MIFIRSADATRVLLSGPSSQITPVPYQAGNRNVGIRFHRGLVPDPRSGDGDGRHDRSSCRWPTSGTFLLAGEDVADADATRRWTTSSPGWSGESC